MIQLWKAVSVGQCKNPGVLEPEAENLKGIVKENKTKQNKTLSLRTNRKGGHKH